jgi:hypothetical protein
MALVHGGSQWVAMMAVKCGSGFLGGHVRGGGGGCGRARGWIHDATMPGYDLLA